MFDITKAATSLLSSQALMDFIINTHRKMEKLKQLNSYEKIRKRQNNKECLKCVLGEAATSIDAFIYSNNSRKIAQNSFLPPAVLLGKPCGKDSGFKASEFHDYLADETIIAVDMYPLPLPSEYYNTSSLAPILTSINGLGNEQSTYIAEKVKEVVELGQQLQVQKVKTICRYQRNMDMAEAFNRQLALALKDQQTGIELITIQGDLSNGAGSLDGKKFNDFISH